MKRIAAIFMALAMVLSLSVTALAEDTLDITNTSVSNGNIVVAYTEGVNNRIVYSVTVDWTDTAMEYQTEGEGTWDPNTHEYENETEEGWKDNTASVTVANHSNAGVTATIAAGNNVTGASYSFDKTSEELDKAVKDSAYDSADKVIFTITADENVPPTAGGTDTFTVTISVEPVTITIDGEEYVVPGNTTWATFAASNSSEFAVSNGYIDTTEYAYNNLVMNGSQFVSANAFVEAGDYTVSYALFLDGEPYPVSDEVQNGGRMEDFIAGKPEFSLSGYTATTEDMSNPVLYTKDETTYYVVTKSGGVCTKRDIMSNHTRADQELSILPVDDYYLLEIAYNNLFLCPNSAVTWRDLAAINNDFVIDGSTVRFYGSSPVVTQVNDTPVNADDAIVRNSVYGIDL